MLCFVSEECFYACNQFLYLSTSDSMNDLYSSFHPKSFSSCANCDLLSRCWNAAAFGIKCSNCVIVHDSSNGWFAVFELLGYFLNVCVNAEVCCCLAGENLVTCKLSKAPSYYSKVTMPKYYTKICQCLFQKLWKTLSFYVGFDSASVVEIDILQANDGLAETFA